MNSPTVIVMFVLLAVFGATLAYLATREEHRANRQSRDPSRVASHRTDAQGGAQGGGHGRQE